MFTAVVALLGISLAGIALASLGDVVARRGSV